MPYVIRDKAGNITRVMGRPVHGAEVVPYDHPDLLAFLRNNGQDPTRLDNALAELRRTDTDMSRIIEDVVMVLFRKNILKMTDLPKAVQEKMAYRLKLRLTVQDVLDKASGHSENAAFVSSSRASLESDNPFSASYDPDKRH